MTTKTKAEKLIEQANALLDQAEDVLDKDRDKTETNDRTTEIVIILDRSGSMTSMQEDMEGGLNNFCAEQREVDGQATLTLVQFDTEYEMIHDRLDIADIPPIQLVPRGGTALLDAVGRTLCTQLAQIPSGHACIVFIATDGMENSSREFSKSQVQNLIEKCRSKRDWQFIFLGANIDSFREAGGIGIQGTRAMNFHRNAASDAMGILSCKVARYRRSRESRDLDWTPSEREIAMTPKGKE